MFRQVLAKVTNARVVPLTEKKSIDADCSRGLRIVSARYIREEKSLRRLREDLVKK